MNSSTLYNFTLNSQGKQEVSHKMKGIALKNLLHNVIREYGKYDGCDYSVNLNDIDLPDMKLLLSYVMDLEDYELIVKSEPLVNSAFAEHSKYIQEIIDYECGDVYREDMWEMGMKAYQCPDNGEIVWSSR